MELVLSCIYVVFFVLGGLCEYDSYSDEITVPCTKNGSFCHLFYKLKFRKICLIISYTCNTLFTDPNILFLVIVSSVMHFRHPWTFEDSC